MGAFGNAGAFLVRTLFDIYILILLIRLIFQWFGMQSFNQIAQFIHKATTPVVKPLQSFLPSVQGIDLAIVCVVLVAQIVKYSLLGLIVYGGMVNPLALLVLSFADSLQALINIFFYAIIISIVISWINPGLRSPIVEVLYRMTDPLLRPARRVIPPMGGFDLSPIVVLIGLQLMGILIVKPMIASVF